MKVSLVAILITLLVTTGTAYRPIPVSTGEIAADSDLGMKLLSQARRLEDAAQEGGEEGENDRDDNEERNEEEGGGEEDDRNDEEEEDRNDEEQEEEEGGGGEEQQEVDITWVSGYSLKFQGCHHIQTWNDDADENEDVRIETKRLVRFRLCPSGSCSARKAAGCNNGYGDYVIDLNTFMESYMEAMRRSQEQECETYLNNNCNCDDEDGNNGDDFNMEECEYDCFANAKMNECVDRNPYEDDEQNEERFKVEEYSECREYEVPRDEGRRKLEDGEEEVEYFVGPYCAEQGGAVHLGMFTDDTCTTFADSYGGKNTFKTLTGQDLPYSSSSMVSADCLSCLELENNSQDGDDQEDEDRVAESCEQVYAKAGKCEYNLNIDDPNTAGCNYIEGIRVVRQDGIINTSHLRSSPVATAFIIIFALAFCSMGFYVWFLRMRLGVKKDALL